MSRKMPDLSNFSQHAAEGGASPKGIAPRPGQIVCGDIDMCIDRNGIWYYHGSPIGRKELVKLFATILQRDEAGAYWLITPAEMARITVEDAPFLAVELSRKKMAAGCLNPSDAQAVVQGVPKTTRIM